MAVLLACLAGMFWKVIFTSQMFFYRDVFNYSYPHARFIHEMCRRGQLPYWNPYLNYGQAVLANPNFLFFYPDTLLLVVLPTDVAYTLHYLAHFALAGVGTYFLARCWTQTRTAAFLSAFFFTFSGPVLSLGNFYNHVAAAAWIPWALLATDRALGSRSGRPWAALTLILALQFLAGEPFTLIATFGLALAYAFYRHGSLQRLFSTENRRIVTAFALVGVLMVALSAMQLLPAIDLLANSRRGTQGLPFKETAFWSFHPLSLLEVVMPDFYGRGLEAASPWTWALSGVHGPYFPSVFIGFVPLFLALAGWAFAPDRRRVFAAAAALILLLLAFGKFSPIFPLAYLLNPLLGLVRFPVKLLVPVALLCALLAGWGYDALRQARAPFSEHRERILFPLECLVVLVSVLLAMCFLAPGAVARPASGVFWWLDQDLKPDRIDEGTQYLVTMLKVHLPGLLGFGLGSIAWFISLERRRAWAGRALPIIAIFGAIQLVRVNYAANPTVPKSFYTYRPPVLGHFEDSAQPYRFCYLNRVRRATAVSDLDRRPPQEFINFDSVPQAAGFPFSAQFALRDRLLLARGSMLVGLEGSLNSDVEGTVPYALTEFWTFIVHQAPNPARGDCLLGRTNVKYEIFRTPYPNATLREVGPIFNGSSRPSVLYENICTVPRAFAVGSAYPSSSALDTLTRLSSPDFEPLRQVILPGERLPGRQPDSPGSPGRVELLSQQPNETTLRAQLSRPGYVVLLDRFDANWHATADGHEVPVLQANLLFRAVRVEAGTHDIRFFYRQRGL
ncbi:MAG: YfhO family protein, partial [Acidobacteriia bacterium]|nr:YfhO family protein [Terriglobia bacterium]